MAESKLQRDTLRLLDDWGYYAVKIITCTRTGWMDIVACAPNGKFVGIELKYGRNKPARLQCVHIQEVLKRGGIAFVAWSLEDVKEGLILGRRDDGTELVGEALL